VSHFNEINVKIYRDQFSKTAGLFRYVKKRRPITNRLPVVTAGVEIRKKLPAQTNSSSYPTGPSTY
jgi:hypothetical protein